MIDVTLNEDQLNRYHRLLGIQKSNEIHIVSTPLFRDGTSEYKAKILEESKK